MRVAYEQANETQRQFAYACATLHGYDCADHAFWHLFKTPPINQKDWLKERSVYQVVVHSFFHDGVIDMPDGFSHWAWDGEKWGVSHVK